MPRSIHILLQGLGIMAYFIRLVRFTPEGLKEMKQFKEKRAKFHAQTKELGISVVAEFLTSGAYDLITILEAPNHDSVMKLSAITGSAGRTIVQTLSAIKADDWERIVESI
ncbi:MAG: GYD domain-containing protein [Nitrososphaerales archaeon]